MPIELKKYIPIKTFELLTYIFNLFLTGDELPADWKNAYVTNIYKKESRGVYSNEEA